MPSIHTFPSKLTDTVKPSETLTFEKNSNELQDWLLLWFSPKVTPNLFHNLLTYFGSPKNFLEANEKQWNAISVPKETIHFLKHPNQYLIEQTLKWQTQKNCHIIPFNHILYPKLLKEIKSPPPLLFVKGDPKLLASPQVSIIGSRNPTPTGLSIAQEFANELSQAGLTITSGLAMGIDTAAHLGALKHNGKTIAVLGSGLEQLYPPQNKKLAEQITQNGALISEFPLDAPPKREHFPQRNRIVSGLSLGSLIVEASIRSGSLITAQFAVEQGKEVFAIPGSIRNTQSHGCHLLIQEGAKLVKNIQDVLEELKGFDYVAHKNKNDEQNYALNELAYKERTLLKYIGYESTPFDIIKERSKFKISDLNETLSNLELKGYIENTLSGYIKTK